MSHARTEREVMVLEEEKMKKEADPTRTKQKRGVGESKSARESKEKCEKSLKERIIGDIYRTLWEIAAV